MRLTKNGFNLIMAIGMILILSGAAIMTMKYVSISAKHITDNYIKEQAEVFAQSVLEATILRIQGHKRDASSGCLDNLTFHSADGRFNADVTINRYYLYNGVDNDGNNYCTSGMVESIDTIESHGYVMIQMIVTTTNNPKVKENHIRIVKRSLQRP